MFLKTSVSLFQMHVSSCVRKSVWKLGGVQYCIQASLSKPFFTYSSFTGHHSGKNNVKLYERDQRTRYIFILNNHGKNIQKAFLGYLSDVTNYVWMQEWVGIYLIFV